MKVTYAKLAFGPPVYWGEVGQEIYEYENECCHACFCEFAEYQLLVAYAIKNSLEQGLKLNDPDVFI